MRRTLGYAIAIAIYDLTTPRKRIGRYLSQRVILSFPMRIEKYNEWKPINLSFVFGERTLQLFYKLLRKIKDPKQCDMLGNNAQRDSGSGESWIQAWLESIFFLEQPQLW